MTGLLVNALNFLPIGRLDGGRVVMSIAGREAANNISVLVLIAIASTFITNGSPIFFFFSLIILFLQRGADIPPLDDVTPIVTDVEEQKKGPMYFMRAFALAICVTMSSATLIPQPPPMDSFTTTTTTTTTVGSTAPTTTSTPTVIAPTQQAPSRPIIANRMSGSSQVPLQQTQIKEYPLKMAPISTTPQTDLINEIFKNK